MNNGMIVRHIRLLILKILKGHRHDVQVNCSNARLHRIAVVSSILRATRRKPTLMIALRMEFGHWMDHCILPRLKSFDLPIASDSDEIQKRAGRSRKQLLWNKVDIQICATSKHLVLSRFAVKLLRHRHAMNAIVESAKCKSHTESARTRPMIFK